MKTICVFCSSSEDLREEYYELARVLALQIAEKKYKILHGAGTIGLMGVLMKTAAANGVKVTGVVPQRLNRENIVSDEFQELIITTDMKERKEYMRQNSDAFITLPGGFGTLEELMETITLKQLKYHSKPIVIINHDGFYNNLIALFDVFYKEHFTNKSYRDLYYICKTPAEAIKYIEEYRPQNIYDKYLRE
jgi:uncharacterized protein (TIGR00730 family)